MNPDIFIALGINSNNVFEPRPKAKFENIQVKVEPSTLLEDFAASSIAAGKNICILGVSPSLVVVLNIFSDL